MLLVDDHILVTDLLQRWLSRDPAVRVVGVARDVRALYDLSARRVDVVLMDYLLPDGNGIQATQVVKRRWRSARVIMLTAVDDDEVMRDAIQAGADGYLTKDAHPEQVLEAIHAAQAGGVLLPAEVIGRLASEVVTAPTRAAHQVGDWHLTRRQMDVLVLLAAGRSTDDVAGLLGITPSTVRTHVRHVLHTLGVHSKLAAVALAVRHGLIEAERSRSSLGVGLRSRAPRPD